MLYIKELGPTSENGVLRKTDEDISRINSQVSGSCPNLQFVMQINLPHSGISVILLILLSVMCETDTYLNSSVTNSGFGWVFFVLIKVLLICNYWEKKCWNMVSA